jgi:hypothetical protein
MTDDMRNVDGGCECAAGERECVIDGSGALPIWFTYPLHEAAC